MKKFYAMILGTVCIFCALLFSGCFFSTVGRTNYYIECTLSEEMVLTGKEVVTYYNDTDNTFSEIKFNLFGNAFRKDAKYSPIATQYTSKAYPNGKSYGDIVINDTMVGNKQVEFSICGEDENILSLKLEEELFPNESCTMTIDFTLNLANVIARTGYNDKTINLANFYPIVCGIEDGAFYECLYYSNGDPFYSDCSDYTVCLTVPSEYVVASSGALTQSKTMENQKGVPAYNCRNEKDRHNSHN